jgi:hypothetical protein
MEATCSTVTSTSFSPVRDARAQVSPVVRSLVRNV